jgi:hypothetical protein
MQPSGPITASLAMRSALFLLMVLWPMRPSAQEPETVVETPLALIHYHDDHKELAKTTGEALEFARQWLGTPLGFPQNKINVYLYDSERQMTDGLMAILGYTRKEAAVIAKVGFSAVTSNTLHIHSQAGRRGHLYWHAVIREYAHGITEERYGSKLLNSARWLYEGLGEFEANRSLSRKFEAFEEDYARWRFKVAFKALISFKLLRFKNILSKDDWYANIENSRERWDIQDAQAYTAVSYLITNYGFDRFAALLTEIKNGLSAEEAMKKAFGLSPWRFELQYYSFLLLNGLFGLYLGYTLALVALGFLFLLGVFLLLKRQRTVWACGLK